MAKSTSSGRSGTPTGGGSGIHPTLSLAATTHPPDRRRRQWRALAGRSGMAEPVPPGPGEEGEVIDGITFTYKGEARCRVCTAADPAKGLQNGEEVRQEIDRLLVACWSYKDICQRIAPKVQEWPGTRRPGYFAIRRHQQRHLPTDLFAIREIAERRALEQGLRIAVGDGPIVTRAALLEIVRDRGLEALAAGELSPTLAETLQAAEALEEIDRGTGSVVTAGELAGQIRAFVEVVKSHVPADTWIQIVQAMDVGPVPTEALPAAGEDEGQ
jgi:hypothetical protein